MHQQANPAGRSQLRPLAAQPFSGSCSGLFLCRDLVSRAQFPTNPIVSVTRLRCYRQTPAHALIIHIVALGLGPDCAANSRYHRGKIRSGEDVMQIRWAAVAALIAFAQTGSSGGAAAQDFSGKPVRMIV